MTLCLSPSQHPQLGASIVLGRMESRGQDLQMSSFSCEGPTRVPCLELFSSLRWHEGVLFYCHQGLSAVLTLTKSREDKRPQDLPGEPSKHTGESPEYINTHSLTGPGRSPGTNSKPTADQTRMLELTDTFWKHSAPEGVECRLWCQSPAISVSQISNGLKMPNLRITGEN